MLLAMACLLFGVWGLRLHELDIERDGHIVANKNAAGFECRVPHQAEVFPVDLGCSRDRNAGVAPGVLRRRGWPFNCKRHFASDAANGQIALYLEFSVARNFDVGGLER